MIHHFNRAPVGFGPGSQPPATPGEALDYLALPQTMATYDSRPPEVANPSAFIPALELLRRLGKAAIDCAERGGSRYLSVDDLAPEQRDLVAETLGEGEVVIVIQGDAQGPQRRIEVQESVFAGIWRLREGTRERYEVGAIPAVVLTAARRGYGRCQRPPLAEGVVNAPAILTELEDRAGQWLSVNDDHVCNLSLLPHTPEDLAYLDATLGRGEVIILSRGYGNCRVESTRLAPVWRVRYFNSQDALIMDTLEVTAIPAVACAAPEDLLDSGRRLKEVVEAIA